MLLKWRKTNVHRGLDGARLIWLKEASRLFCILGGGMV
jgi:hypothetical protein